ncbi:MAG: NAD(P)H-dependent oxidoreductase [Thermomicrobiales bacterium]|nr:NAD(P)H-dependent oxidoreductase [Thermomicrobiales bacterium]
MGVPELNTEPTSIGVIIGSLRNNSINRRIFNELCDLTPDNVNLYEIGIGDLPHYNEDLERDPPQLVTMFREQIAASDGILFITPEYNHSIPGVLKNAIDWASRPHNPRPPIYGKPGAILGGSTGRSGTMRAQLALRQILPVSNVLVMNKPDVYVTFAEEKFDTDGRLADEQTIDQLRDLLQGFVEWIHLVKQGSALAV